MDVIQTECPCCHAAHVVDGISMLQVFTNPGVTLDERFEYVACCHCSGTGSVPTGLVDISAPRSVLDDPSDPFYIPPECRLAGV